MATLLELQQQVAAAQETLVDMTEATTGGGGRLLPEGYAFGRIVEYIELGSQPQEYNGKAKDPKQEAQLAFALWGEGYTNEDGTPYVLRMFPFSIDRNEKARAFKLFKSLNWKGTAKHFAALIGEAYLVKIVHHKNKTTQKVSSRIDVDGFLPPLDPVTKQPYPIPAPRDEDLKLFLWTHPTVAGWDSLYVDGTWDDGQSKNRIQETIAGALDFAGSPLELLLKTSGKAIPAVPVKPATPAQGVAQGNVLPQAPALPSVPAVPVPPPVVSSPALPSVPPVSVTTTSPSSLPGIPALPSIPALPQ